MQQQMSPRVSSAGFSHNKRHMVIEGRGIRTWAVIGIRHVFVASPFTLCRLLLMQR
jgi:hypothetical protein